MNQRRVAVIGSGIAGLTAAYLLRRVAEVTVYDADSRLGGHAHTHELLDPGGPSIRVDSGFIVHNDRTYPYLTRLFDELGIRTQESEMSMSIRCDGCGLEYAGARGVGGLFPRGQNLRSPRYLYLLSEVLRFHRRARGILAEPDRGGAVTLEEFLAAGRFSAYFRTHFVTPLIAAVWSCAPEHAGAYPARYLFEFLDNHGMLSVSGSPTWRTVSGGSATYVEMLAEQLSAIKLSTPVRAVTRTAEGVRVAEDDGASTDFDAAVIATHPDQALALLSKPTAAESAALGAWTYSTNPTLLHTDVAVLPRAARARAAWNYRMPDCDARASAVEVTYDMTRLQRLPSDARYLVSLNGERHVAPGSIIERMEYHHPIFTPESVASQSLLPGLNDGVLAFAGAYHGWGFHEDGCRSGVAAAASLGAGW